MNDTQIADKLKTAYRDGSTLPALAEKYGVYATDIWRAIRKDYVSPKLRRAVDPPRKRTRIIREVSPGIKAWWDEYMTDNTDVLDMIMVYCDVARLPYPKETTP